MRGAHDGVERSLSNEQRQPNVKAQETMCAFENPEPLPAS